MDNTNFSNLINILSGAQTTSNTTTNIPKEVLEQYPYGDFPIRYTRSGQEFLRKNSEARYLNPPPPQKPSESTNSDISTLITLMSLLGGKKKSSNEMFELFSSILFKDNPELKKLIKLFPQNKPKEVNAQTDFPKPHTVSISNLKRVE